MRSSKLNLLGTLLLGTLGGVLAGCQTYDFEPVDPLAISQTTETRVLEAREAKPNMMLLVDTSGSMTDPTNPELTDASGTKVCKRSGTNCGPPSIPCDTRLCPTRWTELQGAMNDFLKDSATIARIGLSTYPDLGSDKKATCGATTGISVPLPPEDMDDATTLAANAEQVKTRILAIKNSSSVATDQVPLGGTPTSQSLQYLGTLPELQTANRSDFVLLLTDGLPNCNTAFADPYPSANCYCTLGTGGGDCSTAKQIGCLDTNASVAAVTALQAKGIKTIVIGFGTDFTSGSESGKRGTATLNGMAEAGGFARKCASNAECGTGDTCELAKGLCTRRFYQAGNKTELLTALRQISEIVKVDEPCLLSFDESQRPSSQELVVVSINDERLSPGDDTWKLEEKEGTSGIRFLGSTCERLTNSSSSSKAKIVVRAVRTP